MRERRRFLREARSLARATLTTEDPEELFSAVWGYGDFRPIQKAREFVPLMKRVRQLAPSTVCEIGVAAGGTTFLLNRCSLENSLHIAVDIALPPNLPAALNVLRRPRQALECIRADSHKQQTVGMLQNRLAGRPLDLLFIDGDHSYEGVLADFRLFSPMVRRGGLIAFHDIVEDFKTRYGQDTGNYTGGVPQFWTRIRPLYPTTEELVEDPRQDGYGIGLIHWDGVLRLPTGESGSPSLQD